MKEKSTNRKLQQAAGVPAADTARNEEATPPSGDRSERRSGEGAHSAMKHWLQQELRRVTRREQ